MTASRGPRGRTPESSVAVLGQLCLDVPPSLVDLVATVAAADTGSRVATLQLAARDAAAVVAAGRSSRRTVGAALLAAAAVAGIPETEALTAIAGGLHAGGAIRTVTVTRKAST